MHGIKTCSSVRTRSSHISQSLQLWHTCLGGLSFYDDMWYAVHMCAYAVPCLLLYDVWDHGFVSKYDLKIKWFERTSDGFCQCVPQTWNFGVCRYAVCSDTSHRHISHNNVWDGAATARNITYICLWGIVSVGLGVMAIISDLIPVITGVLTFDIFGLLVMISVPLVYFLAGAFAWHLYNDHREDHGKKAAQFDPFKHLGVDEIWKWQVFSLNGDQLMPYQQDDHSCTRYSIFVSEIVSIGAGFWYILIAKVDYTFIYIYRIFYEFMLSIKSCDIYQCVTRSLRATMGRPSTPTESQRPRPVTGTVKNTVSHPLRHLHILQLQHTITYYILYIYII